MVCTATGGSRSFLGRLYQLAAHGRSQGLENLVRDLDTLTSSLRVAIHTDLSDGVRAVTDEVGLGMSLHCVHQKINTVEDDPKV